MGKVLISTSSPILEKIPFSGDKGVYVSVIPTEDTLKVLSEVAGVLGFNPDPSKFHVTVMYSKKAPNSVQTYGSKIHNATLDKVEVFTGHDDKNYLAAKLQSDSLQFLHKSWCKRGAEHSFDSLMPHVTLWSDVEVTPQLTTRVDALNKRLGRKPLRCKFHRETVSDLKD